MRGYKKSVNYYDNILTIEAEWFQVNTPNKWLLIDNARCKWMDEHFEGRWSVRELTNLAYNSMATKLLVEIESDKILYRLTWC